MCPTAGSGVLWYPSAGRGGTGAPRQRRGAGTGAPSVGRGEMEPDRFPSFKERGEGLGLVPPPPRGEKIQTGAPYAGREGSGQVPPPRGAGKRAGTAPSSAPGASAGLGGWRLPFLASQWSE